MKQLLKQYSELEEQIYNYFGYEPEWVAYSIDDRTDDYWKVEGDTVLSGQDKDDLIYSDIILKTYKGKDFTMLKVDTQTDGNIFLTIFDNKLKL